MQFARQATLDGVRSGETEWTENQLVAENGDNKLYISNDDKYLYIMAEITHTAQAPVYNLQIKNGNENDKFYWIYYASNGYVYFNNGSYDGCECKRFGNYVEFKIPFGTVMNIYPNTSLSSVRVSIQDSANEWINVGELTGNYNVTDTFYVYSADRSVYLNENDTFTINTECSLENASYEWYKNNEIIKDAVSKSYTIKKASAKNIGTYSVKITSQSGTERIIDICNIIDVFDTKSKGDVNADGIVNTADAVMLQKWLVGAGEITDINVADICKDNKINVFDLSALKRILIK